jgi:hypothetical protein
MWQMRQAGTLLAVPRKRRPASVKGQKLPRINVELYPDEEELLVRARALAVARRETLHEVLIRALEREIAWMEHEAEREARRREASRDR